MNCDGDFSYPEFAIRRLVRVFDSNLLSPISHVDRDEPAVPVFR